MDWLGIDVSKATLDVCLVNEQGKSFEAQFTNDLDGFDKLQVWLAQHAVPNPEIHVCMEATGIYSDAIALFCHETGYITSIDNPARVKAYASSQLQRNKKTDKVDARLIADFCRTQSPPVWTPPDDDWRKLRALVRHLHELKTMRQENLNRRKSSQAASVRQFLEQHIGFLDEQIQQVEAAIKAHIR